MSSTLRLLENTLYVSRSLLASSTRCHVCIRSPLLLFMVFIEITCMRKFSCFFISLDAFKFFLLFDLDVDVTNRRNIILKPITCKDLNPYANCLQNRPV